VSQLRRHTDRQNGVQQSETDIFESTHCHSFTGDLFEK
jgi:hypothetical protein